MNEHIDQLRSRIDELDGRILQLLNERIALVKEIGRVKQQDGLALYDPARERRIMEQLIRRNEGPLPDPAVVRLFERIIDESRSVERLTMKTVKEESPPEQ